MCFHAPGHTLDLVITNNCNPSIILTSGILLFDLHPQSSQPTPSSTQDPAILQPHWISNPPFLSVIFSLSPVTSTLSLSPLTSVNHPLPHSLDPLLSQLLGKAMMTLVDPTLPTLCLYPCSCTWWWKTHM